MMHNTSISLFTHWEFGFCKIERYLEICFMHKTVLMECSWDGWAWWRVFGPAKRGYFAWFSVVCIVEYLRLFISILQLNSIYFEMINW